MATPNNLLQQLATTEDRLLALLKAKLTGEEQQQFIAGFSRFLNNNPITDFVVDFDFAVEWLGISTKGNAKRILVGCLIEGEDYESTAVQPSNLLIANEGQVPNQVGRNLGGAGLNKETIMLTVNGFKTFCMAAGTEKAKRVRLYYVAIEGVMFEVTRFNHIKQTHYW